jgi:large subunit ribosomal protein L9
MKILFIKNVARQGQAGEVKDMSDGFANHLIRNGQAVVATAAVVKQNAKKIEEAGIKAKGEESMAYEIAKRVDGKTFSLKAGANNKGSLYKAIHKEDILNAIAKEIVVSVPEYLLEDVNIKLTGKHKLVLVFKNKTIATFEVEVV